MSEMREYLLGQARAAASELSGIGEYTDALEWLGDQLEITHRVSSSGEWRGADVLVTVGGPHVEVRFGGANPIITASAAGESPVTLPAEDVMGVEGTLESLWECR